MKKGRKRRILWCKKPLKIWNIDVDNIVISKLVETKSNSKNLFGYLDEAIRPLVLILPKRSAYVKTFKVKDGDLDQNNKLMSFHIEDDKLLEKYKTIGTKTEDLKNIGLNDLPVYDDRYIKTKIRTYGDKLYTTFRGLNE